ncbi:galactokinase [Williamsia phyllosphaerae]|uniref:Galactokinase n=1 Tax=Williamsia phyllosphaerae TaxID=885042 RepID=A0ABQ1V0R9_9NOCA|nr:galactokinase [Williamsia phyllosphaerae]GGF32858.1 galactokinase [Williamsia phyllosphaerae]
MTATVVCSAPGRVNLLGEHTDYNGGFALPIALEQRTEVEFTPDGSTAIDIDAHDHGTATVSTSPRPGEVTGWSSYVAGVVWALRENGIAVPGGRMTIRSDVPVGAGLSSSAALECAAIGALAAAADITLDRLAWARAAQRAENDFVGAPTGLLDQLASLHGRVDHALLIDFESLHVTPVPFQLDPAGMTLVVLDSLSSHGHAGGEYAQRRASCERAAAALGVESLRAITDITDLSAISDPTDRRRARHVVTENQRVLDACAALRVQDHSRVGAAMIGSHSSMRDDFEITTPGIDLMVESAVRAGAVGARMTGGGFGGCVIALVKSARAAAMIDAVTADVVAAGFPRPRAFVARAGDGAMVRSAL